jgi:hypothetical protein
MKSCAALETPCLVRLTEQIHERRWRLFTWLRLHFPTCHIRYNYDTILVAEARMTIAKVVDRAICGASDPGRKSSGYVLIPRKQMIDLGISNKTEVYFVVLDDGRKAAVVTAFTP